MTEQEELLRTRLDACLLSRAAEIGANTTVSDLHKFGRQITMHEYLTEEHRFEESEVERLLRFQNPLEVAAECVDLGRMVHNLDLMYYLDRANPEMDYPLREDTLPQQKREHSGLKPTRNRTAGHKER